MINFNAHRIYRELVATGSFNSPNESVQIQENLSPIFGLSGNLRMKEKNFPLSLKADEFQFIHDMVQKCFIGKSIIFKGFECATGFGVSTLAPLLGLFDERKGLPHKLVSMDSYIEEYTGDPEKYKDQKVSVTLRPEDSLGYRCAKGLCDAYDVGHMVSLEIGTSPEDVGSILRKNFTKNTLDIHRPILNYVYLDAGHFPEQIIKDIETIYPWLDKDNFLFFCHDVYPWSFTNNVHDRIKDLFGKIIDIVVPSEAGLYGGENLGLIRKGFHYVDTNNI
jgi:hypothetical protein